MLKRLNSVNLTCILLFLFPLCGNLIKSWTGTIFVLLLILSLLTRPWTRVALTENERNIMWSFVLIFLAIVISGWANGWSDNQTRGLGIYIRFLAAVPVCLLIFYVSVARTAFSLGAVSAAIILALQSIYECYLLDNTRTMGVYESPGLIAGQAMVFGIISALVTLSPKFRNTIRVFGALGFLASLVALVLSGSRASYLSFILTSLTTILLLAPRSRKIPLFLGCTLLLFGLAAGSGYVFDRVTSGLQELIHYVNSDRLDDELGSVGQRLEMWKATFYILKEYPLFGVGWRGFAEASKLYVDQGLIHPLAAGHPHPHNTYLEFLTSSGIFGLSSLLMWIYLGFRNINFSNVNPVVKNGALAFILLLVFMGINEGGLFVYGNSLSFYLVAFGFFMSLSRSDWH